MEHFVSKLEEGGVRDVARTPPSSELSRIGQKHSGLAVNGAFCKHCKDHTNQFMSSCENSLVERLPSFLFFMKYALKVALCYPGKKQ